jgi:NaMN:DMB phosphoribosyltransferase
MLAVAALIKHLGDNVPPIVTTEYVRADKSAEIEKSAEEIGIKAWFVDPDFGNIGDESLARYCGGEVKEGALLAGSMWLAYMTGHSKEEIWAAIKTFLENFGK